MSLRILGGVGRGLPLFVPPSDVTRPTSVMLRRRIFDAYQTLDGIIFIDACAGTGAVGFEAWSRGAKEVYLVEPNKLAMKTLKKNYSSLSAKFKKFMFDRPISLIQKDFEHWFSLFKTTYLSWSEDKQLDTVIFLDPPYENHDLYKSVVFETLQKGDWFRGDLWLESDRTKGLDELFWEGKSLSIEKTYRQGTSYISVISF